MIDEAHIKVAINTFGNKANTEHIGYGKIFVVAVAPMTRIQTGKTRIETL